MRSKRKKFKNLEVAINHTRFEMKSIVLVQKITFWKKKKPYIALVKDLSNSMSYFTAPHGIFFGDSIRTLPTSYDFYKKNSLVIKLRELGNLVMLVLLKVNDLVMNLLSPNKILYKLALAAGTYFKILYQSFCKTFYVMTIPSGLEIRVPCYGLAVLGRNSNRRNNKRIIGSAGLNFFNGRKSKVRGVAMNPVDHPNGGRTKTPKPERSPWGWVAKLRK